MINPLITLVIPLYNAEKYLIETLESIALQSYVEWQCIIVDDESTDHSVEFILEYIKQDDRFIFMNRSDHSTRKGANTCRNIGLQYTTTNWVMFVDADDLLKQDCLKNRIQTIYSNLSWDMYVFRTAIIDPANETIGSFYNPNIITEDIIHRLVAHKVPWHTMSPIWRTDFLRKTGAWNEHYERLQDIELNLRALIQQPLIYFSDSQYDSIYRLFPMTKNKSIAARFGFCRILKDYYHLLLSLDWISEEYKIKLQNTFQKILENQFLNYIKTTTEKDPAWEGLYIETLTVLNLDEEEIASTRQIFNKIT